MNRRHLLGAAAMFATAGVVVGAEADRVFTVPRAEGAAAADDAVKDALKRLLAAGGGTLYFPQGEHRFAKPLDVTLPPGVGLAIRGDGPGLSKLIWDGEKGGIAIRFKPADGAVIVADLSLQRAGAGGDSALHLVSDGSTSPNPKKLVRDVVMTGWACGVDALDCTFLTIDGLDVSGAGTAVRFAGDHDPVDNYVTRLRVTSVKTGIEVVGTCEGVYVTQSTLIGVERGVYWHTPHGEPLLALSGCHIAASRDCVFGHNLIQPIITGNLFYQSSDGGDGEWAGVRLSADQPSIYDLIQVCDNTIHGFPNPPGPRIGIAIENRQGGFVRGNIIQGTETGILLNENSAEMNVLDNVVRGSKGVDVLDRGKRNVVRRV